MIDVQLKRRMKFMSHNLENRNGRYSMFMVGKREDAWHKLGQRVAGAVNWQEAMKLAQLDWTVSKHQLELNGDLVPAWAIVRDNDKAFFGTVGEGFTIKQNWECFEFVDDLLQANGGSHYDSAGALGNGATIWCSVRIPGADFTVVEGDKHESYLMFTTAHDGSMAHTAAISSVRVVCQNTLQSALSSNTGILRIRHTKNADLRFQDAKKTMEGVVMNAQALQSKLKSLAERKMTRDSMISIMDRLFPKPKEENQNSTRRENVIADILSLYESNDKNAVPSIRGTAYNLLNAVTEYTDHYRGVRFTDARQHQGIDEIRAENAVVGSGEMLKSKALEVILEGTAKNPICAPLMSRPITTHYDSSKNILDQVLGNYE
jgi:phage/plasmid-like protein (TIGR03299 family)